MCSLIFVVWSAGLNQFFWGVWQLYAPVNVAHLTSGASSWSEGSALEFKRSSKGSGTKGERSGNSLQEATIHFPGLVYVALILSIALGKLSGLEICVYGEKKCFIFLWACLWVWYLLVQTGAHSTGVCMMCRGTSVECLLGLFPTISQTDR